jgi:hypothetical protein
MHRTIWRTFVFVSAAVLLLVLRPTVGAQGASAGPQTAIPELLVEVRALRVAMEQMASAGPRVQLALGRLQLQEQRVNNLLRRQEGVRAMLPLLQRKEEDARQRMTQVEEMAKDADPDDRSMVEQLMRDAKTGVSFAAREIQRVQQDEAAVAQELAAEQARWSDINQRLEELERALMRK